ncbi:MAG: phytanoyl-CoA dioxygenase family protein [Pseudomonadota bacterium]
MSQTAQNPLPGVPPIESPLFENWVASADLSPEEEQVARDLNENGFAVIDFPVDNFDAMADATIADLVKEPQFADIAEMGSGKPGKPGGRLTNHTDNDNVRAIAANGKILDLLSKIYGRRAFPFQTLNFAMGTQQHYHSDSNHFSSVPERFMVGVWVALEDIGPDQGPVIYYPGTHKWPILYYDEIGLAVGKVAKRKTQDIFHDAWEAMVDVSGIEPAYFTAKKGQALIWAANLLHGGSAQADATKTRWSQVTHYYFDDCMYCVPMRSNPRMNRMFVREGVTDIASGKVVENRYYGRPAAEELPAPPTISSAIRYKVDRYLRRRKLKRYAGKLAS